MKIIIQNINKAFDYRIRLGIMSILMVVFISSCGGTWENNDTVWEITFQEEKPSDIEIIHSYCWKSSHWTYEFETFLELKHNKKWINGMIKDFKLEKTNDVEIFNLFSVNKKPKWFLPKEKNNYIAFKSYENINLKLFLDKSTNTIFFYCQQL